MGLLWVTFRQHTDGLIGQVFSLAYELAASWR